MSRRRHTPAAALVVAAGALFCPPASAAPLANVYADGAALTATVDSGQLGAQRSGNYRLRGTAGGEATDNPHTGWSIHDILAAANVSAAAADVVGGDGRSFTLSGDELQQPSSAFENGLIPIVWFNGDISSSLRPLTPDAGDVNAGTELKGAPVAIYAHSRRRLSLSAEAVNKEPQAGQEIEFRADAGACDSGAAAVIAWDFGDGTRGSGANPRHTYTTGDTYNGVAVADCGDGAGAAVAFVVGVNRIGAGPTPGPGGTATPSPAPTAAPTVTRTPTPKPTRTATPSRGGKQGGKPGGSSNSSPHATATATATPHTTATAAPTFTPTAAPTAAPTATTGPAASATPTATATATPSASPAPDLPEVRGRLVSAVVAVPPETFAAAEAAQQRSAGGETPSPSPRIALPLGLLVLGALLLTGAWRERQAL